MESGESLVALAETGVIQGGWPEGWRPMMWTDENRKQYARGQLRYPSDLTDEE